MSRNTIDFGIDLGTTNSAVAVLKGVSTDIIKNNMDMDTTPSAVYIDRRGQVQVGQRAKKNLEVETKQDDVFVEFKRRMGTSHSYKFKSSGITKSPIELSSEVLKSLREDVMQRTGEDIRSTVITIPAMFEQRQCNDTKQAGLLAGFSQTALLQEPVAASLAYGFQGEVSSKKRFWLVYDFGGGTFDAAVLKTEDGDISVVNHGGDNFLGGADIDWGIIEQIIVPQLISEYDLPDFNRGNLRWHSAFSKIKRSVEEAKILLSRNETAYLESCTFCDASGNEIDLDGIKLVRNAVVDVATPLVERSCNLARNVVSEKGLALSDLERVLLVGGPTLAPWFRDIISSELGIPLDFSLDPLTVVARGAAVFAGTQRISQAVTFANVQKGEYTISLNYQPVGVDEDPRVSGEVSGANVEGCSIEFVNRLTQWRSGKIALRDGKFSVRILAEEGERNTFDILLSSSDGTLQKVTPDTLDYTIGTTVKAQIVAAEIAIAKRDNTRTVLVPKGTEYPFKITNRDFRTAIPLQKGNANDKLIIPIISAKSTYADCNEVFGNLTITGADIPYNLPVGSTIEITLKANEPGKIDARAYLPDFDYEVSSTIGTEHIVIDEAKLRQEITKEEDRINELDGDVEDLNEKVELIQNKIEAAGDSVAAEQAQKYLFELRAEIHKRNEEAEWPRLVEEGEAQLSELSRRCNNNSVSSDLLRKLGAIKKDFERARDQHKVPELKEAIDQLTGILREFWLVDPEFWKGIMASLYRDRDKMSDTVRANQLFAKGADLMKGQDVGKLSAIARELLKLLPIEEAEKVTGALNSGILEE